MVLSERLNTPISTAELERRWVAVRAAMARAVISGCSSTIGGRRGRELAEFDCAD